MKRREFIPVSAMAAAATAAATSFSNPGQAAGTRPPNLIFVLADQWRAQTLPVAGDVDLTAPNLYRLSKEGTTFTRCYATNPVCSPSRASLITGRYPHACGVPRNDVALPAGEPSIARQMKAAGRATGYIGKWHLDGEEKPGFVPPGPRRRGFDYWAAFNRGHSYFDSTYYRDTPQPVQPGGFEPDYQTDLAIDFIKQNRARPFYLFLSWGPPHTPRTPPPRAARAYQERRFHLAGNVPESYAETARRNMAGYYGLCTALDENVGRLMQSVEDEGLADDTYLVFTSDHGDMLGAHGLEFKGVHYEESARVPLIVRGPGMRRGASDDLLMSNADLMPSLLSLCGAAIPEAVQGRDLAAAMRSGEGERPESVYAYGRLESPAAQWRMVVRGLDKLVVNARMEATHLYNLGQDPLEMRNLAAEAGSARQRNELRAHLRDWMKRLGDGVDPSSGLKVR